MNAWGLGCAIFLVGGLIYIIRHRHDCNEPFFADEYRLAPEQAGVAYYLMTAEDLAGATIVLPAGVEIVIPDGWSASDVDELLETAQDIDAWGATA